MAEKTKGEVRISAPVERVAQVISDLERYPEWTEGMGAPDVLERDAAGLPILAEFEVNAGPVKDRVRLAYSWQAGAVSWSLVQANALKALNGSYSWLGEGDSVRVVYELELDLVASFPSLLRKVAERAIISSALEGLKRQAEGRN